MALAYNALQGFDDSDPAIAKRPLEAVSGRLELGSSGLRIAVAVGYFAGQVVVCELMDVVATRLDVSRRVDIAEVQAARAAAFLITMAEGAALHADRLRSRAEEFD